MDMIGKLIRSLIVNHKMLSLLFDAKKENCKQVYIGETKRMLKFRLDDHRGYGNKYVDTATGSHFNQPDHSLADMSATF